MHTVFNKHIVGVRFKGILHPKMLMC